MNDSTSNLSKLSKWSDDESIPMGNRFASTNDLVESVLKQQKVPPKGEPIISERWLQVIGAFFIFFNAWGLLLAFGTFEVYYESQFTSYSRSEISWIATISAFLLTIGGTFTGRLYDQGFNRPMLLVGGFLVVFGTMMTSLGKQYYEVFLAEGVCVGLGLSLLWIPALSNVATRFEGAMRAITVGIVSAGSSFGGVLYPIVFHQLQPRIGFGWTVRVIGFMVLFTMCISLATMLPAKQPEPSAGRKLIDVSALKDWPFVMVMVSGFFVLLGYYVPIVYLPTYTLTNVSGGSSGNLAFYTVVIANAASCPSRILAGIVVGKTGPFVAYVVALLSSAVLLFAWIAVKSIAGMIIWTILYGFMTGLVISIPGSLIPLLCPTPNVIGTRMGMAWFGAALGILVGSPIGGALITTQENGQISWWPLQVFSGIGMLIGGLLCIPPWLDVNKKLRARARLEGIDRMAR